VDVEKNTVLIKYLFILLIGLVFIEKSISGKLTFKQKQPMMSSSLEVPEVQDTVSNFFTGAEEDYTFQKKPESNLAYIYFIKFYGSGNRTHTKLARVKRKVTGNLSEKIWKVLKHLSKGPKETESAKGVISGFNNGFRFKKRFNFQKGVLNLYLPEDFDNSTSAELMQDRLDQIVFTLLDIEGIEGIQLWMGDRRVTKLASGMIRIPELITKKNNRKVIRVE
jgi:spore germination protein GerM